MRFSACLYAMLLSVICLLALPAESATTNPTAMPEALIGTWRLVTIEYSGPVGPLPDPLFWPGSQGLIMYDRSGWMSVQIYAPNRPPAKGPPRTSGAKLSVEDAGLKAAGFDTYYAYLGTWDFDAQASAITHHVKSSLLPEEIGQDLRRDVAFDGQHLKLTVHLKQGDQSTQRVLTWERASSR
jgi:hypothetical protein